MEPKLIFADKVKAIAIAIGSADYNNLGDVGKLLTLAEELLTVIPPCDKSDCKALVENLKNVFESFVMGEYGSKEKGISAVADALESLENSVQDGCSAAYSTSQVSDLKELQDYALSSLSTIEELEGLLLDFEQRGQPAELLNAVFRIVHTLKGETGFAGFSNVAALLHHYEGIFAILRDNPKPLSAGQVSTLLSVVDLVKKAFETAARNPELAIKQNYDKECEELSTMKGQVSGDGKTIIIPAASEKVTVPEELQKNDIDDPSIYVDFIQEAREHLEVIEVKVLELETTPKDTDILNDIFRPLHTIKGVSAFLALKHINRLSHDSETLLDYARTLRILMDRECIDMVFEVVDCLRKLIHITEQQLNCQAWDSSAYPPVEELIRRVVALTQAKLSSDGSKANTVKIMPEKKLGEILIEEKGVSAENVQKALDQQKQSGEERKLGQILMEEAAVPARVVSDALRRQADSALSKVESGAIKVNTDKLDHLIEVVGELVISQTLIVQHETIQSGREVLLTKNVNHLTKIVRDIQHISMSLRMVPIKQTFQKMARLVRDVSMKSNKQVELTIKGAETELDKNVVEQINDPLIHMIRNSVDHGIESEEERLQAGKPAVGNVGLNAYHQGGNIVIEVTDDGKGLNKEAIRNKAIEKGMLTADSKVTDDELHQMIFAPGFSTAKVITDVSGRGVGMDVVKKNIEKLGGTIAISTTPGKGSTFFIRLPLTMAILDGMILALGVERYLIPITTIKESIRPEKKDITKIQGLGEVVNVRGMLIPLIRLHKLLGEKAKTENPWDGIVVIVEFLGRSYGLLADAILGQQQVVIKSMKGDFRNIKGISGCSIMGDGRVGLILDVKGIVEMGM